MELFSRNPPKKVSQTGAVAGIDQDGRANQQTAAAAGARTCRREPEALRRCGCSKLARIAARQAVVPHSLLCKWLILRSRARQQMGAAYEAAAVVQRMEQADVRK